MKIIFFWFICIFLAQAQKGNFSEKVSIKYTEQKTQYFVELNGALSLNVSQKDLERFKAVGFVQYNDFGAIGDGIIDDIDAIAATHAFANEQKLNVKANQGATYYFSGKERIVIIKTDTDFGNAAFIIDDTDVQNNNSPIFKIASDLIPFVLNGVDKLKRNQEKIDVSLPVNCLITVTNSDVKHYIRFGLNQNDGAAQTDIFMVDKNGKIDMDAPIIWDFDKITEITALPINKETLKINGGIFTTIANKESVKNNYYNRNIAVRRSNVVIDGLKHLIIGEGEDGAPYGGFINISDCSYITVKNTILTGHKTYEKIGNAGKPVSMGTYDLSVNRALNVSFVNCSQTNDINDTKYWGILGSNYCKNLLYDGCTLSRFDAHKGVANATIRNSTLGHMGINAIGSGKFLVENSTINGRSLINLRSDYGSSWQGEFIIRDCIFVPSGGKKANSSLINGYYSGKHDFGYICYMPEKITIENLQIDDANHTEGYLGPALFSNFNSDNNDITYYENYPYIRTKEVILKNVTTASGKTIRLSDNKVMFNSVKVSID